MVGSSTNEGRAPNHGASSSSSSKQSTKQSFPQFGKVGKDKPAAMSNSFPVLDTGLIAVALIIRSREGPRFVFHYPARPTMKPSQRTKLYGTEIFEESDDEEEPGDESDDSDPEESDFVLRNASSSKIDLSASTSSKTHHVQSSTDGDEHYDVKGVQVVPWESLFEWSTTDLESILTPNRAFHKKKFELELEPFYYISYPIHIREDGSWGKKKAKKSKKSKKDGETDGEVTGDEKPTDPDDSGGMTMFNVVFILDLERKEAQAKILDIYENVVKIFNKALKAGQASSNYVWKESEMILAMKEKAREERRPMSWLWAEILIKSTLAAAIRDVYTAISDNNIAHISLATKPALELSLQIPIPTYLSSLPTFKDPGMPGLLLTAAHPFVAEEGSEEATILNKHFALLLLNDEDKIVSEIQTDNTELAAPLTECIRVCKPTLSFLQVAQTNSLALESILVLAQHLIYWRKALAIPPIHQRDMYIVSPNCDSRKLPDASVAWKKAFPLAPALPSFLATLSAAPRPYKTFIPSKTHRPVYLNMLAWLIRGGWVTPLRTFAWVLVWPEFIYEVEYQLKAEALERANKKASASQPTSGESAGSTDESGTEKSPIDPTAPLTDEQKAENARLERIAEKAASVAADEATKFAAMEKPVATEEPSANNAPHLDDIAPYVIKDPHKVTHEESLYIAAIGKRFQDEKLREYWGKWSKYWNGEVALEMIPLNEGMKRKEAWAIFHGFQEHLLFCKHW